MKKTKKIPRKPFKNWDDEQVSIEFGLKRVKTHIFIENIDAVEPIKAHPAKIAIEELRESLKEYVETWNEDELKTMFINPFVRLANFVSPNYKVFTQRPMSIKYANDSLITEGKVEFMLAKGLKTPRKPYFFLHEYKPEKRRDNDPCGQLLIAMVASQKMNDDQLPLYGIYVVGRNWFFVILDGNEYAVSKSYSAEDEEVFKIFAMLLYIKDIMEKIYAE
ncbi:MAG: hypothetical protein EAZ97_01775 [Bacteroidetes bacterium]|nr:MAG: hypothetical protein EAZ97_01775 [Bacteroidota bacterium]